MLSVCAGTDSGVVNAPLNWSKGRRLGRGGFGEVFVCYDRDTGRDLAVKEVLIRCPLSEASEVRHPSS